jgi:hypothetical protein
MCMLHVDERVLHKCMYEDLQHSPGLIVNESRHPNYTSTSSQPTNC